MSVTSKIVKGKDGFNFAVIRTASASDLGIINLPTLQLRSTRKDNKETPTTEDSSINESSESAAGEVPTGEDAEITNESDRSEKEVVADVQLEIIKLSECPQFSAANVKNLAVNNINTVAELEAYLQSGKPLEDLSKIGVKSAQAIQEEYTEWNKEHCPVENL